MRTISLQCGSLDTVIDPRLAGVIASLRLQHEDAGWLSVSRGMGLRLGAGHKDTASDAQWRLADRSPSSARLVREAGPVGLVVRAETLPGRVAFGIEIVNISGGVTELSPVISWRLERSLTKHAEDPSVEISASDASVVWSPSGVALTVSASGATPEIVSDHASTDAPWFTLGASSGSALTLAPGERAASRVTLSFTRGE